MNPCAVCNLRQIESWTPSTDRDRLLKALNLAQAKRYIARESCVCECDASRSA